MKNYEKQKLFGFFSIVSYRLLTVNYFRKKFLSKMFDRVLNMSLMGYRCKNSKGFRDRRLISIVNINPLSVNPTTGQTHSNNSSAIADELFEYA